MVRLGVFAAVAAAVLVALPSIGVRFATDDYAFRALLRAPAPLGLLATDLFRFTRGQPEDALRVRLGRLPWWTAPDLKIHFLRPLTGLLFAADDAVFGDAPLGYHLHSILWYAIAVGVVAALFGRLFPGASAVVAALVFAWSHAHVLPYGWVSARHVLVGGAFAVGAIWARVRWRADGWRPGRWLAPVALAAGLAGSEGALAGVVYWVAYEIAGPGQRSWKRRLWGAAPALAVASAYLCIYRLAGGGVVASGGYHDPLSDPLAFVGVAVTRFPALLGDALLGVPAELANLWPAGPLVAIGLGGALLLAIAYVCCRPSLAAEERAALRWLVLGALGSTLIGVSGFPGGRVLFLPDVGFAALIGILVRAGLARAAGVNGLRRGVGVVVAAVLVVAHLVLAPISSLRATARTARRARATEAVAASIVAEAPASGRAFLLSASDPLVFLYPRAVLAATAPGRIRCLSVMSAAVSSHRLRRTGDRTFELETLDRPLLDGSFDTLFRASDRPFAGGETVRSCGATIRVAATRQGKPARLDVELPLSLDSADAGVLVWRAGRIERFVPPPIGGAVDLPWSPGPE